ncbi:SDR family oxidoreductase [Acetobacteraceae bacterium KSS8]|uniref:SDR family oxidoreductase n=1 Tax=Endosaccharibacter trunci TaxID=2812733 RepID=A0ABT1WAZ4_9PROT|nr:SDR family oxidoreductase [Acetobacteraceae bacterium KSS8]
MSEQSGLSSGPSARRLEGRHALVTAAAQGIGRATALRLAREGARVIAADVNATKLAELEESGIETLVFDAADPASVQTALAGRRFDIVVNCVGWVHQGTILEARYEDWNRSFQLNVGSMFLVTQATLPAMLDAGKGSIVNIASVASSVKGFPRRAAYGASKAAVIGLTKSLAADYVGRGIRCNAVCPGTVASPSLEERIAAFADPVAARADFIARQPMGRLGTADEIAAAVAFLASDESAFMTGSCMILDGGAAN